jgi:hypothetical protein
VKDLDFDEIDRAVNSIGTNPGPAPVAPPSVGRPTTGRFMDVVQPSSNMRVPLVMPERPSREGMTINPISTKPVVPDDVKAPPANDWPDPIDMQNTKDTADKDNLPKKDENEDADIDRISDDIANTLNPKSSGSMDSPFLSDTKVEKRPLGGFSTVLPTPTVEPPTVEVKPADKPVPNSLINVSTPLPAELQDDLLKIESNNTMPTDEKSSATNVSVADTPPAATSVTPPSTPLVPATTVMSDDKPTGPTSITQQYTEKPSTGDQSTGSIYDTKDYHKALMHPANKKPSWMWIVWIVILLVVGAGAGASVYFFVLPNL